MKKFLSVMTAAVLAVTLTGCAAARMSKAEYKKKAAELIDKYLCAALIDTQGELEYYNMSEYDRDALEEIKSVMEKGFKKADEYLDQLEKLNPPEEMEDFHEDLLSCIEKARDTEEKTVAVCDAPSEEKFQSAREKANSAMEKIMKKAKNLVEDEDNDWLMEELEDGDFMEEFSSGTGIGGIGSSGTGGSLASYTQKAKVTSADATAKTIRDTVTMWIVDLETNGVTIPKDTVAVTIEGHVKNGEWIGSVSAPGFEPRSGGNEMVVKKLKQALADSFDDFTSDVAAVAWVSGRRVVGCAFSDSGPGVAELEQTFTADTFNSGSYPWNGQSDGITMQGKIVGTCPKLMMKNQ